MSVADSWSLLDSDGPQAGLIQAYGWLAKKITAAFSVRPKKHRKPTFSAKNSHLRNLQLNVWQKQKSSLSMEKVENAVNKNC